MTWTANIASPKVEKHTLIVLRPRKRVTGWELFYSGTPGLETYRIAAPGYVLRVWNEYANDDGLSEASSIANAEINLNTWFYDSSDGYLYFTGLAGSPGAGSPDELDLPGLTVEFEIHLSDQAFIGPRDPKVASSTKVEWKPALKASPFSKIGSRQNVYGFFPVSSSTIEIMNHDGWLNELLYNTSFNLAICKGYILAADDLELGATYSLLRQCFSGFTSNFALNEFSLTIECVDFSLIFNKEVSLRTVADVGGTTLDPASTASGQPWFYRRIFGRLEGHLPINIDYNATPGPAVNRTWVTHDHDVDFDGNDQDDGTIVMNVNSGGANSATRTYITGQIGCMPLDSIVVQRSGVDKYARVSAVNHAGGYIDHTSITGSAAPGDTVTRHFVTLVTIRDADGFLEEFVSGRDFDMYADPTTKLRGFTLHNDVEIGLGANFDPATWKIFCTVYGRKEPDQYLDASDVGATTKYGGVISGAASVLYRLIADAGFSRADISEELFQQVDDDPLSVGFAIPTKREDSALPTYLDLINQVLQSNIYRLYVADDSTGIKLGISEVKPFETSGDYSANELNHRGLAFQHDYSQLYSSVTVPYQRAEYFDEAIARPEYKYETAESLVAKNLHFVNANYPMPNLLFAEEEAVILARRMAFILGDRRGFWEFDFELPYINSANIGATYRIHRQFLPGAAYVEGELQNIELGVAEVQKNINGVNIVFEDQKGVQDNAADW